MTPSARDIILIFRETGCPISDCRDAISISDSLDGARKVLETWKLGKPSETGAVPTQWKTCVTQHGSSTINPRKCPKCRHYFEAIPDVVTCNKCGYSFRSSSPEFPNLFLPLIKTAPSDVSEWFFGDQLARIRHVFGLMSSYWPVDENEQLVLSKLASEFGSESAIDLTYLLRTLSGPKLRAIGELFVAIAGGDDTIDHWIATWREC